MNINTAVLSNDVREHCDFVGEFHEGLARAKKDGKWFHVGFDGSPAYDERYCFIGDFHEGLARAKKGSKYFHIRPDGTQV